MSMSNEHVITETFSISEGYDADCDLLCLSVFDKFDCWCTDVVMHPLTSHVMGAL